MGCCLEFVMLAWGGYLIFAGECPFPGGKPIKGAMVRLAGIVFALPLPLSFLIGFFIGFSQATKGAKRLSGDSIVMLSLMELGIIAACFVIGLLMIVFACYNQPERRRDEYDGHSDPGDTYFGRRRDLSLDEVFETHGRGLPPSTPAPLPEHAQAVVAERPVAPPPLPREDSFAESEFPPPRRERRRAANEKKQNLVMLVIALVLFLAVAGVGAVVMWPK